MFFSKDTDNLVPHKQPIWQTDDRSNLPAAIHQINPMPHFGKLMHTAEANEEFSTWKWWISLMCPVQTANLEWQGPRLCSLVWRPQVGGSLRRGPGEADDAAEHAHLCKQPQTIPCCHHQVRIISVCSLGSVPFSSWTSQVNVRRLWASCERSSFLSPSKSFDLSGMLSRSEWLSFPSGHLPVCLIHATPRQTARSRGGPEGRHCLLFFSFAFFYTILNTQSLKSLLKSSFSMPILSFLKNMVWERLIFSCTLIDCMPVHP